MSDKLLLICMTKNPVKKAADNGIAIQKELDRHVNSSLPLRLYHYRVAKKKAEEESRIALPLNDGKMTMLLKHDKPSEKHLLCLDIWTNQTYPSADIRFFAEVADARPRAFDLQKIKLWEIKKRYAQYAIGCDALQELRREVHGKDHWHPYVGDDAEAKKWYHYLRLHKALIEKMKVEFLLTDVRFSGKGANQEVAGKVSSVSDEITDDGVIASIGKAGGETVHFSFAPLASGPRVSVRELGKLRRAKGNPISVSAERKEVSASIVHLLKDDDSLSARIKSEAGDIICSDYQVAEVEDAEFAKAAKQSIVFSRDGVDLFTAQGTVDIVATDAGEEDAEESENAADGDETAADPAVKIDRATIQIHRLHCSINFWGDAYQLERMEDAFKEVRSGRLWPVLSGKRVAKLPKVEELPVLKFVNPNLNDEQKSAVRKALAAQDLCLIWGPPGTGKTEVIREIAAQEALRGGTTLITSQSNLAVDNALGRLHSTTSPLPFLDECFPFRITKAGYQLEEEDKGKVPVQANCASFFLRHWAGCLDAHKQQIQAARLEMDNLDKDRKGKLSDVEKRQMKQLMQLYKNRINTVGATLMGVSGRDLKSLMHGAKIKRFDTVIVDEVSKATPPELFIPLSKVAENGRVVLVGDFRQLPPIFKHMSGDDYGADNGEETPLAKWAAEAEVPKEELDIDNTIFERLWKNHKGAAAGAREMLQKQYRMPLELQRLIEPFYTDAEGTLQFGLEGQPDEIEKRRIKGIPLLEDSPAIWIDTPDDYREEKDSGGSSYNVGEIQMVDKLLGILAAAGNKRLSVGVITFYGAQLRKLSKLKYKYESRYDRKFGSGKLIFGTVDSFQGRECDIVICSLVRCNKGGNIGFAQKRNRINVAFSRARSALIILGSSDTFCYGKDTDASARYRAIHKLCRPLMQEDVE